MSRKSQKLLIYSAFLVVAFLLIFFHPRFLNSFGSGVVDDTSLPLKAVAFPLKELRKVFSYHRTYNQYKELKEEVDTLKRRLIGQEEIMRENSRFRKLLDFKQNLIFSSVAANVIGRSPTHWNATLIIDKGSKDGIAQGLPVVTPLGVVGKIAETGAHTSKVLLLNDPNFSVAGLIERNRESGIVSGTLGGLCRMRYISPDANVRAGDKVITSKSSSTFPEGLVIGEVVSVEESQSNPTIECLVEPIESLSQIEEVIVILK